MRSLALLLCIFAVDDPEPRTLQGHAGSVLSVAFSPDGRWLASGARDDAVRIWDPKTGAAVHATKVHGADVYAVAFSPDGRMLASGGADRLVRLWETGTWMPVKTFEGHQDTVRWLTFSRDGKLLATSSVDRTIRLWDLTAGTTTRVLQGHAGQVRSIAFSPDGTRLASAATDGSVRLWNTATGEGEALPDGHTSSVETVAWAPDGGSIASGSNDATVRVWRTRPLGLRLTLRDHGGEVDSIAFSPDGATLATGCKDQLLRLWSASDGTLLRTIPAHGDRVESVAFSPDGALLATGSGGKDASIKLWDARKLTGMRSESFDRDPGWDGRNNRSATPEARVLKQDFGWSEGRVGGLVTPSAEPAYYGKKIASRTFEEPLSASGTLVMEPGAGNTLVGFFNAETVNEWRNPNAIMFRLNGRGEEGFHVHLEYATAKWRAGANCYTDKKTTRAFRPGTYSWSLVYDPKGDGTITATLNGEALVLPLDPGHKADGATFNRFGILNVMKSADGGGTLWLDDVTVDGDRDPFDADPKWDALNARRTFTTENIRPRFNFGYSATHHAGGAAAGEMGGLVFRGDQRYPDKIAYYGDRLEALTLERPLRASGKVSLRRGVTDSTVLIGFFHSTESMRTGPDQRSGFPENFLGISVEGPSREGFLFYPAYGVDTEGQGANGAQDPKAPHILPDGASHSWTLEYDPKGGGTITVSLDGKSVTLSLQASHRAAGARFDRFGLITTHIDGNAQQIYFDDLTYTWTQDAK